MTPPVLTEHQIMAVADELVRSPGTFMTYIQAKKQVYEVVEAMQRANISVFLPQKELKLPSVAEVLRPLQDHIDHLASQEVRLRELNSRLQAILDEKESK